MCSGNSTNTSLVMSGQISQQSCFSRGIRTYYFPEQWWADAYSFLINILVSNARGNQSQGS